MSLMIPIIFAASAVISDPLSHANGTPIAGTYTEASNAEAASVDPRPLTTAATTCGSAWDARLVFWYVYAGWKFFEGTGFQVIVF